MDDKGASGHVGFRVCNYEEERIEKSFLFLKKRGGNKDLFPSSFWSNESSFEVTDLLHATV